MTKKTILTSEFIESAIENQPTISTLLMLEDRQHIEEAIATLEARSEFKKFLAEPCYLDQY
jgi:hypothetical protein